MLENKSQMTSEIEVYVCTDCNNQLHKCSLMLLDQSCPPPSVLRQGGGDWDGGGGEDGKTL